MEVFNRQLEIINLKLRRELGMSIHSKNEHRVKKMWYIHIMEYYSAIKMKTIGSFVEAWMDLVSVIQSEVSLFVKTNTAY